MLEQISSVAVAERLPHEWGAWFIDTWNLLGIRISHYFRFVSRYFALASQENVHQSADWLLSIYCYFLSHDFKAVFTGSLGSSPQSCVCTNICWFDFLPLCYLFVCLAFSLMFLSSFGYVALLNLDWCCCIVIEAHNFCSSSSCHSSAICGCIL